MRILVLVLTLLACSEGVSALIDFTRPSSPGLESQVMFTGSGLSYLLCWLGGLLVGWLAFRGPRRLEPLPHQTIPSDSGEVTHQLNYHFVFNSLTTIRFLTREDAKKAGDLILHLSSFLKSRWGVSTEHSLQQELELCHAYLRLEEARLEERLRLEWKVENSRSPCSISVGSLQDFLEQVVTEKIRKEREGGTLSVTMMEELDGLFVEIDCDRGLPEPPQNLKLMGAEISGSNRLQLRIHPNEGSSK